MSKETKIPWCDSTINFWTGCTKQSPGCDHCYAEARDRRHMIEPVNHCGPGAPCLHHTGAVKAALATNKKPFICDGCGEAHLHPPMESGWCKCGLDAGFHRHRIFVNSMSDWLDNEVPIEWLAEMLDTIRRCDQVIWILCSKRWENFQPLLQFVWRMKAFANNPLAIWLADWANGAAVPPNIIGLCSIEDQQRSDERIPGFLKVPLACRGLSMEPLLGAVELSDVTHRADAVKVLGRPALLGINWIIVGGESGPKARPCNVEWIRSIVLQGQAAGVPVFVKQLGAWPVTDESTPDGWPVGTNFISRSGDTALVDLKDKSGSNPAEWPTDLRFARQWSKGF